MFYGFVITEAGNNLLAKMVAGEKLTITKVVMDKGTATDAEAARKLTAPIDPGPKGTSTVPTVEGNAVNLVVEYRSDLDGGLQAGFWIGGFAIYGKTDAAAETMIAYGSLGDAKQYVSAYVEGTATDVRRYPVSITVTAGVEVEVSYPAEAWMTAEDVAELFNQTLKPALEAGLDDLIDDHNKDPNAHNGAIKDKQDAIKVEGLLKGIKNTGGGGDTYKVGAAKPGTDYQQPTNALPAAESLGSQDCLPIYTEAGQHKKATLQELKSVLGVWTPKIKVKTCTGATVTATNGATNLQGTGTTTFELPNTGTWTVKAVLSGQTATQQVEVAAPQLYEVDLRIATGIAVTKNPDKTTYYIGEQFSPAGMVVTATFADSSSADVTGDCTFTPQTMAAGTQAVTVRFERGGIEKTTTVAVAVRVLDHITVSTPPNKTAYKYGETFKPAGMVVTAHYTDSQSRAVTGYTYSPTGTLGMEDTTITVTYEEGGVTKQATQAITVAKVLDRIAVTHAPNKTSYFSGQSFQTAGMVVTAYYTDGSSQAVSGYTYSPTGALSQGNTSITISYAEGGVTKTTTQAITVTTISNTLNSNTWATIRAVSDAGQGDNYWDVGDTKQITINGKVGNFTFSNLSIAVFILGFNHNSSREGTNRIHFQIGKISNKLVAFHDSRYRSSVSESGYFSMNTTRNNFGGWSNSYMRKELLGNSGTPSSPPENSMLAALPPDLRVVLKPINKYSDNIGGQSEKDSFVSSATDYLTLLAEYEYYGRRSYANNAEQNYQKEYDYYKAGNSTVHRRFEDQESTVDTWTRSVSYQNYDSFCTAGTSGIPGNEYADYSFAISPAFAV